MIIIDNNKIAKKLLFYTNLDNEENNKRQKRERS
jgi:hypothetical protein